MEGDIKQRRIVESETDRQFLLEQFRALREEILALQERGARVQLASLSGIPLLIGGAKNWELNFLLLSGPLIILASTLFLVFNQNSIMRAGEYMREHVEKRLKSSDMMGWEEFLEENTHARREVENVVRITIILVFAVYYVGAAVLAYRAALTIDRQFAFSLGFVYAAALFFCVFYIFTHYRAVASTRP